MKHHICGRRPDLEGDVQPLGCQDLDSYVLKSPLLDGHKNTRLDTRPDSLMIMVIG